ncbi:MAG TPA: hypothetical protein VK818_02790 [Methylomirabilota bacterium]|nr:hypothetical protein [Methylomirabilota bacterium]
MAGIEPAIQAQRASDVEHNFSRKFVKKNFKSQIARSVVNRLHERKTEKLLANEKGTFFRKIWKRKAIIEKYKNNVTRLESGAGDGNRTRI